MGKTRDLFKKIRDTRGKFHTKMDTTKERNGMDLTEAEDIKKRQQEYWSGLPFPSPGDKEMRMWQISKGGMGCGLNRRTPDYNPGQRSAETLGMDEKTVSRVMAADSTSPSELATS